MNKSTKVKNKPHSVFELRLKLSKKALRELKELQWRLGKENITEVIVSSVKLLKYINEQQIKGRHILIEDEWGNKKELISVE